MACGCAEMPPASQVPPTSSLPPHANRSPLEIGVLIAPWHSGLVLPANELGPLHPLIRDDPRAELLGIGWGNRRFYMATRPSSGDALAALFRSPSALFVQPVASPADLSMNDARIHWLCLDRRQLRRAESYIETSLYRRNGNPVDLGPGPLPESHFYASSGHYSALHTCNTWTVGALEYAGLPVHAGGVIFAGQARRRIRPLPACPPPVNP